MPKKVLLKLNPFEAGLLVGVLIKEINSNPDCKESLDQILRRLIDLCQKEYYEDGSND